MTTKHTPRTPQELTRLAELFHVWQKPGEFEPFLELIRLHNQTLPKIIEIGSYAGGTAAMMAEYADFVISVDINRPLMGGENIIYITGSSHDPDILHEVKSEIFMKSAIFTDDDEPGVMADVLFIDGDHSLEGVKKDFEIFKELVRPGGMVAFHDIVDTPHHREQGCLVGEFWNSIKANYKYQELITAPEHWGGIGVLFMPEK